VDNPSVKIIHVIASPSPGGIETYVKDLAIQSVAKNHVVHIFFLESANEAGTSGEFEKEYLAELDSVGVNYFFVGRGARRCFWRGITRLRRHVRENAIDVYHSHLTYGVVFGALVGIPRVYTHHSVNMRVGRLVFSLMNNVIDQLVGISKRCSQTLSRHSARRVTTILNAVDLKRFSQGESAVRTIDEVINCISVGRICAEKNFELLVSAVACLPDNVRSHLTVSIVGAGSKEMTARLEKRIVDEGVGHVIRLLGSRRDVPALLASSDAFLMSSSSEGLPIALIEAAVSGLPCVVTDVGGCREVIEACQNGVVADPDDAHALAQAIESLVSEPDQFRQYSKNALSRSKLFSIETAAASHVSLYQQLLDSHGQASK
jgi:glycosyltransferase involved in cell wall biosynthesis